MAHEYKCCDCGEQSVARRSDAKRCRPCRVLQCLLYTRGKLKRPRKCQGCAKQFRPLRAAGGWLCGECRVSPKTAHEEFTCTFCKNVRPGVEKLPVCWPCATDPPTQDRLVKSLRKGQRDRKARHGDTAAP